MHALSVHCIDPKHKKSLCHLTLYVFPAFMCKKATLSTRLQPVVMLKTGNCHATSAGWLHLRVLNSHNVKVELLTSVHRSGFPSHLPIPPLASMNKIKRARNYPSSFLGGQLSILISTAFEPQKIFEGAHSFSSCFSPPSFFTISHAHG